MFKSKKQNARFGCYPSNDLLNNALRYLLREDADIDGAISEIVYAIDKADGYICDDVYAELLKDEHWQKYFS